MASTFHQSFLHILNKDDQDFLEMGFKLHLIYRCYRANLCVETKCHQSADINSCVFRSGYSFWGLIQFVMHYQQFSGQQHLCVMAIVHNFTKAGSPSIAALLDQEAAAILMKFADYRKEDPTSFKLSDNFSITHGSCSISGGVSFNRHILNEEDANNLLIMIKPTFNVLPQPVLLDSVSIKPNIILLDTFFHILMFHRESFFHWRKAGCQDHGSYKNFKELLEALVTDAQSKLNPSTMHMTMLIYGTAMGTSTGPVIFTEDVNLQVFMEHLKHLLASTPTHLLPMPPHLPVVHICLWTTTSLPLPSTTLMHSCGSAHSLASVHSIPYTAAVLCSYCFDPVSPPATHSATKSAHRKSHNEDFQCATSNFSTTNAHHKSIHKQHIKSEWRHHDKLWVIYHWLKDALLVSNQRSSKVSLLNCATTHVKYLKMTSQQLQHIGVNGALMLGTAEQRHTAAAAATATMLQ
ncbi:hypothetical protein EDC04DRAFT_2610714 [Pisolithus marmoratus]|nr:hypothetical protein EDC04DRAFT_2610714 [Pisolithus marmoratus]